MQTIKRLNEYFTIGSLRIILIVPIILLLLACYFSIFEIKISNYLTTLQIFVTISGVLLGFSFHSAISLGLELNKILKATFLREYWKDTKRHLALMITAFSTLLAALIFTTLLTKIEIILSNDPLVLLTIISFALFLDACSSSIVNQYLSLSIFSNISDDGNSTKSKDENIETHQDNKKTEQEKQHFLNLFYLTLGLLLGVVGNLWVFYFSKWLELKYLSIDYNSVFYFLTVVFVIWFILWIRYLLRNIK